MEDLILYHGSRGGLQGPIAPISRVRCDFGKGFYMGTNEIQAKFMDSCPFCGNEAYQWFTQFWPMSPFLVKCSKCGAGVSSSQNFDDAIDIWNTRIENVKPTRCPWCGRGQARYERKSRKDLENYGLMYCPYCGGEGPHKSTKAEALAAYRKRVPSTCP